MRGPRPNITWYLFNLLRLVAVVFMVWALVAQFVALASDLGETSKNHHSPPTSSVSTTTTTRRSSGSSASSLGTALGQSEPLLITAPGPASAPSTPIRGAAMTATGPDSVVTLGPAVITTTPALVRPATLIVADAALTVVRPIRRAVGMSKREEREDEEEKPSSGVYGLSSVPTTSGGILFSCVSRVIMATILTFLLLAQLGIPEQWLYTHTPAFGPQSTPLWLGVVQVIIAVEGLRVYSVPIVWSAHAGLLVIGMINSHLALALIFLAKRRKLPKDPAPALYLSRTTRLLFFRRLPPCYAQLLSKEEREELDASITMIKPTKLPGPGISTDGAEHGQAQARNRWYSRNISAPQPAIDEGLTDVRRGGYPTFARGGLGAAGSQIPAGTIDRAADGKMRGLISRPAGAGDRHSLETTATADAYSGYGDDESRGPSRNRSTSNINAEEKGEAAIGGSKGRSKPAPLGLSPAGGAMPTQVGGQVHPLVARQQSIRALREKIHQRMERKASLETGRSDIQSDVSIPGVIPTITHTAPSAALSATSLNRPPRRSTTIDSLPSAGTFGGSGPGARQQQYTAGLRSIPRRGNTISQIPSPATRPAMPVRASTRDETPPPPIAKSPGTESMFSSILPWKRPSRAPSPAEPMPNLPEAVHHLSPSKQDVRDLNPHPDDRPGDAIIQNSGAVLPAELVAPSEQGVTRTPSGSKLQKRRNPDKSKAPESARPLSRTDPLALATAPISRDTIMTKGEASTKPLVRQDTLAIASRANGARSSRETITPGNEASTKPLGRLDTLTVTPRADGASSPGRRSPNTLVKAKKRSSPLALLSSSTPSPPVSPLIRPQSSQGILQRGPSSLRSSMAPLNRQGSMRSTRSTRTAMGVRFDLGKRYSSSSSNTDTNADHESLLSPETATTASHATPRSARFRIPGTNLTIPFPGTPRRRPLSSGSASPATATTATMSPGRDEESSLILEMESDEHGGVEAARPESFASRSSTSSVWFDQHGLRAGKEKEEEGREKRKISAGDRAGLPKRSASIITEVRS